MSVFQLPKTLCRRLNSMMARFWWRHKENLSRTPWLSWKKLSMARERGGLGYRDLEAFNSALLAKQGWRLFQYPQSLVSTIFREKYYKGGSILEANLGQRPSYAWCSIWNSMKLLKEGLLWRVGDGKSIKIWGDRWLPHRNHSSIQSPVRVLPREATVSALIDPQTRWWNSELIYELFHEEEALRICNIAISPASQPDRLVWRDNKNGLFTIRSAYYLAQSMAEKDKESCSDTEKMTNLWKSVWHVKGPPVVKLFLWKTCRNILATKENLYRRNIVADPLCPICGLESESVGHILWRCESVKDVWLDSNRRLQKSMSAEEEFIHIFAALNEKLASEDMQLFAAIIRQLWLRRNTFVFQGYLIPPAVLIRQAREQLAAFAQAESSHGEGLPQRQIPSSIKWQKPRERFLKVNWDASVDMAGKKMEWE